MGGLLPCLKKKLLVFLQSGQKSRVAQKVATEFEIEIGNSTSTLRFQHSRIRVDFYGSSGQSVLACGSAASPTLSSFFSLKMCSRFDSVLSRDGDGGIGLRRELW